MRVALIAKHPEAVEPCSAPPGNWKHATVHPESRAYRDSLFMARVAPAGMLFIPCRAGVSHRPGEYAAPDDIGRGVRALAAALGRLAAMTRSSHSIR
jgi:acetylornithine deacetylase/succinyl-diaminopimelate desuccinylase-like protein